MNTQTTGLKTLENLSIIIERKLNRSLPFELEVENINASEFENTCNNIMKTISNVSWLLEVIETNEYYDSSRSNNGGGYSQPFYQFKYADVELISHDTSCGDFGQRMNITLANKWCKFTYHIDGVGNSSEYYSLEYKNKTYVLDMEENSIFTYTN